MPRKYEQRQRAQKTTETRQRIVQAAVELHGILGPARTTVSAIAERAGLRRATVYEHFPDERALFDACTRHYFDANPPPDLRAWAAIPDPLARLAHALEETFAYHRRTEPMMSLVHRDAELVPVMFEVQVAREQERHWQEALDVLLQPWHVPEERRTALRAAVQHALEFQTWRSLVRSCGLSEAQAVDLMVRLASCST